MRKDTDGPPPAADDVGDPRARTGSETTATRAMVRDAGPRVPTRPLPGVDPSVHVPESAFPCNALIASLPCPDRVRLLAGCETVDLVTAEVLLQPGDHVDHVHFPTASLVTLASPVGESTQIEVGLVGDEGMVESAVALGMSTSPLRAIVQSGGATLRMAAVPFRRELARSAALRLLLDRYLFVRLTQIAQAAGCVRYHVVEARLARWLLMTQDRLHSNAMHVTHESLARTLGVRRAGVTRAALGLQKRGTIRYQRGDIAILDRGGLKLAACSCYATDRATYRRVLGSLVLERRSPPCVTPTRSAPPGGRYGGRGAGPDVAGSLPAGIDRSPDSLPS